MKAAPSITKLNLSLFTFNYIVIYLPNYKKDGRIILLKVAFF
jgi:hypothetical protein